MNAHVGTALAGVELLVNQLNSGTIPGIAVVDAWEYNDSVALICAIGKSVIPKSIVPGVPDWFFLADSGSGVHLVWGRVCCDKLRVSHIMISDYDGQTSATTEVV